MELKLPIWLVLYALSQRRLQNLLWNLTAYINCNSPEWRDRPSSSTLSRFLIASEQSWHKSLYHRPKPPRQKVTRGSQRTEQRVSIVEKHQLCQSHWPKSGTSLKNNNHLGLLYHCKDPPAPSAAPGGSDGKECACNAGDLGSIPGEFHGQRSVVWSQRVRHDWATNTFTFFSNSSLTSDSLFIPTRQKERRALWGCETVLNFLHLSNLQ